MGTDLIKGRTGKNREEQGGTGILKAMFFLLLPCSSLFLLLYPLQAQTPFTTHEYTLPAEAIEKMDRHITLDLRGIHVLDVIKFLSEKADLNIVASQNIEARVTLFLKDVTIGNAFEIILLSTGLASRVKEGIFYVMTDEEYTALYGEPYRDQRHIKIIQLLYADATKVGEIIGGIKSAIGKVIIDKQTATMILIDTAEKIKLMEEAAQKIDIPTVERVLPTKNEVFELSYNKAVDVQAQIVTLLTPGVGSSKVDEKTNRIFVTDFDYALKRIRELIEAFDRKTREVFIEAKMVQVRLSNEYQAGIDWEHTKTRTHKIITFPKTATNSFGRLIFGDLGRQEFEATVDLLHAFGATKTLAAPQMTVEHNQEATILVGTREAYVTSTVSQASSTTTTSEAITFIDVGVKLKILPTINKDDFVSLKITPEVSAVGRTLVTANNNEIPIVDTTNASTQVLVKDGHTVLIGGLMKDEAVKAVNKIPVLGDIPLLGAAFRNVSDEVVKTELVIFLTPHIVQGDEARPFSPAASGKAFEGPREISL